MQAVCDNIDAWAMWLSPPAFIIFNMAYWLAYQEWEDPNSRYSIHQSYNALTTDDEEVMAMALAANCND